MCKCKILREKWEQARGRAQTMNCLVSGQADLLKRLMAIQRSSPSFPLYTTLGAFSPCSDTMLSTENPEVAALSWSKLYSLKEGNDRCSLSPPNFSNQNRFLQSKHYPTTITHRDSSTLFLVLFAWANCFQEKHHMHQKLYIAMALTIITN